MKPSTEQPLDDTCPHCQKRALVGKRCIDSALLTVVLAIRCRECPFKGVTRADDLMDIAFLWGPDGVRTVYDDLYADWLKKRIHGMHPLQALGDMA